MILKSLRNELSIAGQNTFCVSVDKVSYSTIRLCLKLNRELIMLRVRDNLVKTEKMEMTYMKYIRYVNVG